MSQIQIKQQQHFFWQFDSEYFSDISKDLFTATYWQHKDAVIGQESGRGTTWFVQHGEQQLVLRHYLRGGMMRYLSHDRYFFNGYNTTRSIAEFRILDQLLKKNLPVPKPAAAQFIRHGLLYEADLLTHKIPNARDLVQILKQKQSTNFYQELGRMVAKFHQQGVFHADLNIQNILLDQNDKFWLIDFDRARILPPQAKWQQATLNRLKRSFEKERVRFDIKWSEQEWAALMKGYMLYSDTAL
jgi:3-deoxy-D-manno-octulosonic acid kinase